MESIEIKVDQLQESKPVKFTLGSEEVCVARIGDEVLQSLISVAMPRHPSLKEILRITKLSVGSMELSLI